MEWKNGIFKIKNGCSDKKIIILGSVHGNELSGYECINKIANELKDTEINGEILLIIANPEAKKQNKRFIDEDMNRLFDEKTLSEIKNGDKSTAERKRINELLPLLENVDYLIDLHNTIKPSIPFIFCENTKKHLEIAKKFNVKYVISPDLNFKKSDKDIFSSFDSYIDRKGGIGLTIECGSIENSEVNIGYNGTISILKNLGFIKSENKNIFNPKQLIFYKKIYAESDNFSFLDDKIKNFSFYKSGGIFANDNNKNIFAEKNSYIIFPKLNIKKGDIVCFLAKDYDDE